MEITRIEIHLSQGARTRIRARAAVTFERQLVVAGITVVRRGNELKVVMPGSGARSGEAPVRLSGAGLRAHVERRVLEAYRKAAHLPVSRPPAAEGLRAGF